MSFDPNNPYSRLQQPQNHAQQGANLQAVLSQMQNAGSNPGSNVQVPGALNTAQLQHFFQQANVQHQGNSGQGYPPNFGMPINPAPQPTPQPGQAGSAVNLNALQELLRNRQITLDQYNQMSNPAFNRPNPPPIAPSQHPSHLQPSPHANSQQLPLQQQQQQQQQQQSNGDRIPFALLQPHLASISMAKQLQHKAHTLERQLQAGVIGTAPDGSGGQKIGEAQRSMMQRETDQTKVQLGSIVHSINDFQKKWGGGQKITADWQYYSALQQQQQHHQQLAQQPGQPGNRNLNPGQIAAHQQQLLQRQQQMQQIQQQNAPNNASFRPPPPPPNQERMAQIQAQMQATQAASHAQQLQAAHQRQISNQSQSSLPRPPSAPPRQPTPSAPPSSQQHQLQPQRQQPPASLQLSQSPNLASMMPSMGQPGAGPPVPGAPMSTQDLHLLQTQLDPKIFMKSLFEVMRKRGEPITGTPFVEGREVDIYQLYQAVMKNGGSQQIDRDNSWHLIVKQLGWDNGGTVSAAEINAMASQISKIYASLLRPFEEVWAKSLLRQQHSILDAQRRTNGVPPRPPSIVNAAPDGQTLSSATAAQSLSNQQLLSSGFTQAQVEALRLAQSQNHSYTHHQPQSQAGGPQQSALQSQQQTLSTQATVPETVKVEPVQPRTNDPSLEQMSAARAVVTQMRQSMEANKQKLKFIHIADEDKVRVATLTHELTAIVKKVVDLLPVYLAMSGDSAGVSKLLQMQSIFGDQLKYISGGQYALDIGNLEKLRDQFLRCYGFVQSHHRNGAALGPSLSNANSRPAAAAPPPTASSSAPSKDQFGLMAQKTGIRVEDLRPPPLKSRKSVAPTPPSNSSAFSPTPMTPQDLESPPKDVKTPRGSVVPRPKPTRAVSKKETPLNKVLKTESVASPLASAPSPQSTGVEEAVASLKRKRDLEDAEQNPDEYIERTLRGLDRPMPPSFLARDVTSHLPFDYDPVLPSVQEAAKPLFFSSSSSQPAATQGDLASFAKSSPAPPAPPPFDFDSFIDITAAGLYEAEPEAETPDLVDPMGDSPPSDEENDAMNQASARAASAKYLFTPGLSASQGDFTLTRSLTSGMDDYDKVLNPDQFGLPETFSFDGDDFPGGNWAIFSS